MTENKTCQNCKQNFQIVEADFEFYKKISVPAPTFCPDCRTQRRMVYRNERTLYKDTCDLCKKSMLSSYAPGKPFTVYCKDCWYGDGWDPLQYGRTYDFNKPFFEQFKELMQVVPRLNLMYIHQNVGCDFANFVADAKNVYLSFSVVRGENVFYSRVVDDSRDVFDSLNVKELERCYQNIDSSHNYDSAYMIRSRDCVGSRFLFDCVNCQDCFMSSNLRSKRYVIRNKQLSKEEYEREMAKINTGSHQNLTQLSIELKEMIQNALHKFSNSIKIVASTGDNLMNAKNAIQAFDSYDDENIKYCIRAFKVADSYDVTGSGGGGQLLYEATGVGLGSQSCKFVTYGDGMQNVQYSDWCPLSTNLFGCNGVRKQSYCIFNKQYSKEEYQELVKKIIEQMKQLPYKDAAGRTYSYGEFFPIEISPFSYNETVAQEYFPLTKEQAAAKRYPWHEQEVASYQPTITSDKLPDDITQATDQVCQEIIGCPTCQRVYRILPVELAFLKTLKLALPRHCPECRYRERFAMRNPYKLWPRQCMCDYQARQNTAKHQHHASGQCPNTFETTYAPGRSEIVYCEACYQQEVV